MTITCILGPPTLLLTPRDLRTHILRLCGPKTILHKAFGAILILWVLTKGKPSGRRRLTFEELGSCDRLRRQD